MNRINKILAIAVGVQAGLMALTWTTCQTEKAKEPGMRPLFDFDVDDLVGFEVVGQPRDDGVAPDESKLIKKDDKWVVANAGEYPADEEKVKRILEKLFALKIRTPIATNAANHNSLKVGDREYGRKVTVDTGSQKRSLYIGGGSGSTVHVRFLDSDDVYRCSGMSVWTVTAATRTYVDNKYINIDKDKVSSVTLTNEKGRLSFAKKGDAWTLTELPRGEKLDQDKVVKFVEKVVRVPLNEPIGKEVKPEYNLGGIAQVAVTYTEGDETKTMSYAVGDKKPGTENYFYVKGDDNDFVVTASKYNTQAVRENSAADFLAKKDED